ncbi:MAG: DNA-binding protein WhiA [Bacilli bacterium]|nr:DNA-binding protein WhiA [Bacilli bacterium]
MSFTTKIKNEISEIYDTRSEMIAELSGFIRNNGYLEDEILYLTTENKFIAERIVKFLRDIYDISVKIGKKDNVNFSKTKLNLLTIDSKINKILQDVGYFSNNNTYLDTPPTYIVGANEEIRAYLRGAFLCQGSINDPKSSYHMEFLVDRPDESVFIQRLLNIFDLNAKILSRSNGYMIYIKEADKISDFLKIIRAHNAVLYFEDIRVYHQEKNIANRLNNCEQANIDKIIQTANIQLKYIEIIEKNLSLELLDDKTKEVLEYRKKYPEASLKELSEIISLETNKPITKSGLNHRFRKMKELAERLEKN